MLRYRRNGELGGLSELGKRSFCRSAAGRGVERSADFQVVLLSAKHFQMFPSRGVSHPWVTHLVR